MNSSLEIKHVPFLGTELMAARDADGQIWAGVRWMCDGIGLSEGRRKRQIANIATDKVLFKGASNLVHPTKGGPQMVLCLKLEYVPLWLAKISITPKMERDTPEVAERLEQYQLRAKDVLAAAFLPPKPPSCSVGYSTKPGSGTRALQEILGAVENLTAAVERGFADIGERLEDIESRLEEPRRAPEPPKRSYQAQPLQPQDVEKLKEIVYGLARDAPIRQFWDSTAICKEDAYRRFEECGFNRRIAMRALRESGAIKLGKDGIQNTQTIHIKGESRRVILVLSEDPRERICGA